MLLVNKRSELIKLHEANNAIARENGFSVIEKRSRNDKAPVPYKAQDMAARGKKTWFFDMRQKADFARACEHKL
jgi:hypothetical protein